MASSRVFVRGLPAKFTDDDLKNHFSAKLPVTDCKIFPHRRIGYVGYKTSEDAMRAVKYFNKSYIRMSRIYVEPARPVSEARSKKPNIQTNHDEHVQPSQVPNIESADAGHHNNLKRKRDESTANPDDPKLQEYLKVLQPPSKTKSWQAESYHTVASNASGQEKTQTVDDDEENEYPSVKRAKPKENASSNRETIITSRPGPQQSLDSTEPGKSLQTAEDTNEISSGEDRDMREQPVPEASSNAVSNSDWLRSRTSRLLDLVDESESPKLKQGVPLDRIDEQRDVQCMPEESLPASAVNFVTEGGSESQETKIDNESNARDPTSPEDAIGETKRLYLRNLSYEVSEDDLRGTFSPFGHLEEVHVPLDTRSGHGKGFAYVLFQNGDDAVEAFVNLDGKIFQGRLLHILPAERKRDSKLDDFEIAKLPLKKQMQIKRKMGAATSTFNWNALYMNTDAVMSSVAHRLGVKKSDLLDPTSSDAAVKQAHAETHVISETKSYFAKNGVDIEAFKNKSRGDRAILVKNFPFDVKSDQLKSLFEEHGQVTRFLMPPSGTIAIVEFAQATQARAAFHTLAYRKIKDSVLFLEKAPKELFSSEPIEVKHSAGPQATVGKGVSKLSATDLLQKEESSAQVDTSTLYVKNLSFSTTTQRLSEVFRPLDGFVSATVKTKTNPKTPNETLSMGYGFLEFSSKQQAEAALSAMNGFNLDGHELNVKPTHRGLDAAAERRKEDAARRAASRGTKVVIKNLPFSTSKKDVRALLGAYGQLRSVRVPKKFDRSTRGFAFADFLSAREAENAMDALRNTHLLGRRLILDFATADAEDAEEEIERMQKKVGSQINKVAIQRLTGAGRKKFNVAGKDDADETYDE